MTAIPFLPLALAILAYFFRRDNQRRKWDRQYRQTWTILVDRDRRLTESQKEILRIRVENGLRLTGAPKGVASDTMLFLDALASAQADLDQEIRTLIL